MQLSHSNRQIQPSYLGNLVKGYQRVSVSVRVLRKWTFRANFGKGDPLYIGLVLADTKGDAMYAEIPETQIQSRDHLIHINNTYVLSKFKVRPAKPSYMPFHADLMIEFTEYTMAEAAKNQRNTFPLFVYSLTPIDKVIPCRGAPKTFTDVIGYIKKYTSVSSFIPKGQETGSILRELFIRDLSDNEIKITLWGDHATSFNIDHLYDEESPRVIVLLVLGCLPRTMYSTPNLSGSTACSDYFNPDIKEAQPFYDRFNDEPVYIERPPRSEEDIPIEPQICPLQELKLADLDAIDPYDFLDGGYKCTVTVTHIADDNRWWYMACAQCTKKSDEQPGGGYQCSKGHGTTTVPRYRLSFLAKDDSCEASFFAYDEMAARIIQRPCKSILNPLKIGSGLPRQLQDVISKKFTFAVTLTEESLGSRLKRQYLVKSILERSDSRISSLAPTAINVVSTSTTASERDVTVPGSSTQPPPFPRPESLPVAAGSSYQTNTTIPSTPQTPTTAIVVDHTLLNKDLNRESMTSVHVQRSLFTEPRDANKEILHDKEIAGKTESSQDEESPHDSDLPLKSKRPKISCAKNISKNIARKT